MTQQDEVRALRAEVSDLKLGTTMLTEQVETLSGALTSMNELQIEQRMLRREVENVDHKIVPREELEAEKRETEKALKAYRRRMLSRIFGVSAVLALIVAGVTVGVVAYLHSLDNQLGKRRANVYNACVVREEQVMAIVVKINAEPRDFPVVDCESLRP